MQAFSPFGLIRYAGTTAGRRRRTVGFFHSAEFIRAGGYQIAGPIIAVAHPLEIFGTGESAAHDFFRFRQIDLFHYNILIYIKIRNTLRYCFSLQAKNNSEKLLQGQLTNYETKSQK
jgi:hypothetical protein